TALASLGGASFRIPMLLLGKKNLVLGPRPSKQTPAAALPTLEDLKFHVHGEEVVRGTMCIMMSSEDDSFKFWIGKIDHALWRVMERRHFEDGRGARDYDAAQLSPDLPSDAREQARRSLL